MQLDSLVRKKLIIAEEVLKNHNQPKENNDKVEKLKFNNGYFPIPRKIINKYKSNQ